MVLEISVSRTTKNIEDLLRSMKQSGTLETGHRMEWKEAAEVHHTSEVAPVL